MVQIQALNERGLFDTTNRSTSSSHCSPDKSAAGDTSQVLRRAHRKLLAVPLMFILGRMWGTIRFFITLFTSPGAAAVGAYIAPVQVRLKVVADSAVCIAVYVCMCSLVWLMKGICHMYVQCCPSTTYMCCFYPDYLFAIFSCSLWPSSGWPISYIFEEFLIPPCWLQGAGDSSQGLLNCLVFVLTTQEVKRLVSTKFGRWWRKDHHSTGSVERVGTGSDVKIK